MTLVVGELGGDHLGLVGLGQYLSHEAETLGKKLATADFRVDHSDVGQPGLRDPVTIGEPKPQGAGCLCRDGT
jgi:hypothetical protein